MDMLSNIQDNTYLFVPQGSVLGPTLFIIYVNDLPSLVQSSLTMFADDTKVYRAIRDTRDAEVLQSDLETLSKWSHKWLLKFNETKCAVMHCGVTNPKNNYYMKRADHQEARSGEPGDDRIGGQVHQIAETKVEKDLGVYVCNNLKPTTHCHKAANKAMQGWIFTFSS